MKIKRERLESITNTSLTTKKFKLSEDSEATRHIIEILTRNLYTNPQRSAIREILGNAIDASIENNNKRVDLLIKESGYLESIYFLEIRDYGPGIDEKRMDEYVRQIGNSSKRDSDEQIGALGIGICTLFCIGEQVFIEAYTKENKITYLLYRDSGGIPCYDIKKIEENNEEETGTNIKVLIEGRDILNKTIRYILENCFLIEIDLYTNLHSLAVLSSWASNYKIDKSKLESDKELKYIETLYIFPIRRGSNNNNRYGYDQIRRFENRGGYKRIEQEFSSIQTESINNKKKLFDEELIHYRGYNFKDPSIKVANLEIVESLTDINNGIIPEDSVIIMMGDSLYTLDISLLKIVYINDSKKEKEDNYKVIETIYQMNRNSLQIAVRVPIGSIRFSSNRENIVIEDNDTREYILNALREAIDNYINYFLSSKDLNKKIESYEDLVNVEDTLKKHSYLFNLTTVYIPDLSCRLAVQDSKYIMEGIIKPWSFNDKEEANQIKPDKPIIFDKGISTPNNLLRSKDITYGLTDTLDSYLVGPSEQLNIHEDVIRNLSNTISTNNLTKQKLSRIFTNSLRYYTKNELLKDLLLKNKIKIILSTSGSISEIRKNKNLIGENEPFILIVEKETNTAREIRNSIAYRLLDVDFFKSNRKEKKKKEISIEEKEYKSFSDSISSCRVLKADYCLSLILGGDYNGRKYDLTEKLEENIFKQDKLNNRIIYEELDLSYITRDLLLRYWFVDLLIRKGYIKQEDGKINRLLFLTPLSASYLRENGYEVGKGYKLRYFRDAYKDFIYKLYKKNRIYIDNLLYLGLPNKNYSYYNNNSYMGPMNTYCVTGQIEKLLIKKGIKCDRSIIKICFTEMAKFIIAETIGIKIYEKDFIYKKKEYTGLENIIRMVLNDIKYLKIYKEDKDIVSPFNWLLGYNTNNMTDARVIGDYLDTNTISLIDKETGKLNVMIENVINRLF